MSNRRMMSFPTESSKRAEKRSKKQHEAIIAATMEDRNVIRLSGGDSNSPRNASTNTPGVAEGTQVPKRKTRGPAKLKISEKGKQIEFDRNCRGQPIGVMSSQFSSHIGSLVREHVKVNLDSWKDISEQMKDILWTSVQQKFVIADCYKHDTFMAMGKLWRNFKSTLTAQIKNFAESGDATRHLALIKPDNLTISEWDSFVKKRRSVEFKEKSKRFKDMRAKQTLVHTMSRKGYARLEDEMKKESPTPSAVSRVDVWIRGHTRKNGEAINEITGETMRKIKEYSQTSTASTTGSLRDDAVTHVLGPERRGRVRGLGFGARPSKVDAQMHQDGKIQKLEAVVYNLAQQFNDMQSMLIREKRNEVRSGGVEDMMHTPGTTPQSQHASTGIPGGENVDNAHCKLLHWAGTGEVVAEGQIASTNPTSLVHHVPLGPGSWKVWVHQVRVQNVPLFRPTREFFLLDEAIGSTTVWPIQFISLDN